MVGRLQRRARSFLPQRCPHHNVAAPGLLESCRPSDPHKADGCSKPGESSGFYEDQPSSRTDVERLCLRGISDLGSARTSGFRGRSRGRFRVDSSPRRLSVTGNASKRTPIYCLTSIRLISAYWPVSLRWRELCLYFMTGKSSM
jgi:hypothetical protein